MNTELETRPPVPPFTQETATQKVRGAEDGWNSRDPERVSLASTPESEWRNRAEFLSGRPQIVAFLTRKWVRELDYRLIKELWAFTENRIAVRFAYEWHDDSGHWDRSYGNENWEFDPSGLMTARRASINDLPMTESDRKFFWPLGRRPDDHPGLSGLGLSRDCPRRAVTYPHPHPGLAAGTSAASRHKRSGIAARLPGIARAGFGERLELCSCPPGRD